MDQTVHVTMGKRTYTGKTDKKYLKKTPSPQDMSSGSRPHFSAGKFN
jgi:hypothetical protein